MNTATMLVAAEAMELLHLCVSDYIEIGQIQKASELAMRLASINSRFVSRNLQLLALKDLAENFPIREPIVSVN
jgi:hypothetical protein